MPKGTAKNNRVNVEGIIISDPVKDHEVNGKQILRTAIKIERLSHAEDIIPLLIEERLLTEKPIKAGMLVRITGEFRSYDQYTESKRHLILYLFVKGIEDIEEVSERTANRITLEGHVCRIPTHRTTPKGTEITDLLLSVTRASGKPDYIPCICWNEDAVMAADLKQGDKVNIFGRIQSRIYQKKLENDEVENRTVYEVSIGHIEKTDEASGKDKEETTAVSESVDNAPEEKE